MSELEWQQTVDGYESGEYRIRHLADPASPSARWRLDVVDLRAPQPGSRLLSTSLHPSLRAARDRARRDEQDRVRRARISSHLVVGGGALLSLVAVGTFTNLAAFLAVVALMYVGFGSLADATWIWMNDAWGSTRARGGPEPMTWSDRVVVALIERHHDHRVAAARAEPVPAILVVPAPAEHLHSVS